MKYTTAYTSSRLHYFSKITLCYVSLLVFSNLIYAAGDDSAWQVLPNQSTIAYGSIKKNSVGEVNRFTSISGSLSAQGKVSVSIDLSSVETNIGIRNERMLKYIFGDKASTAMLTANIDMAELDGLAVGNTTTIEVAGQLNFLGQILDIDTLFFVAKLSNKRLLVVSESMVMVKTDALGAEAGIDKLMALAKLPSITRVAPVTLRLVLDKGNHQAAQSSPSSKDGSVPKAVVASNTVSGDATLGKKVFRQCQACHNATSADHGFGPHLVGIVGRKAGAVEDYSASEAIKASGIIWTVESLSAFIAAPMKKVPGTKMPFAGISSTDDVKHLVAYLNTL